MGKTVLTARSPQACSNSSLKSMTMRTTTQTSWIRRAVCSLLPRSHQSQLTCRTIGTVLEGYLPSKITRLPSESRMKCVVACCRSCHSRHRCSLSSSTWHRVQAIVNHRLSPTEPRVDAADRLVQTVHCISAWLISKYESRIAMTSWLSCSVAQSLPRMWNLMTSLRSLKKFPKWTWWTNLTWPGTMCLK